MTKDNLHIFEISKLVINWLILGTDRETYKVNEDSTQPVKITKPKELKNNTKHLENMQKESDEQEKEKQIQERTRQK